MILVDDKGKFLLKGRKKLCEQSDLKKGFAKTFQVDGEKIAVYFNGREVFAFTPFCPHARANLTQGTFDRKTVTCHWHGWCFDLESGNGLNNKSKLKTYAVSRENGAIYVDICRDGDGNGPDPDNADFFMPKIKWKNS